MHESAGDIVNLAESLTKLSGKVNAEKAKELLDEADKQLNLVDKKYGKQPIVMMRRRLVEAEMLAHRGQETEAESATSMAIELHKGMRYSAIANTDPQICIDCALAFINRGRYDEGEAILQELARINTSDSFALRIDKLLREPQTSEGIAYAAGLNKGGIEKYEKGDLDSSIISFKKVLQELPNHIGINLNLIQALTSKQKKTPLNNSELEALESSFMRIGEIQESASQYARFAFLKKRYTKITQTTSEHS
jgi:tetratricopeptide (TPR) repeat protein